MHITIDLIYCLKFKQYRYLQWLSDEPKQSNGSDYISSHLKVNKCSRNSLVACVIPTLVSTCFEYDSIQSLIIVTQYQYRVSNTNAS